MNERYDFALGSVLGALIGDAAGATLEFLRRAPRADEVEKAMGMVGGGVFQLAPGQITDDGELTLAMARGLADHEQYDVANVAVNYARWIVSEPFDIGNTTSNAMEPGAQLLDQNPEKVHNVMTAAAAADCMESKANGSLMRATPLGVWAHGLEAGAIAACATADSRLSHPNPTCCDAVACYCIAIASLVNQSGDRETAWQTVNQWASANACSEVQQWLQIAESGEDVPFYPLAGFVKIAFIHAFQHLLRGSDYSTALQQTLAGGGDTDTNACIVGGLIGAACGASELPEQQKFAVLDCSTSMGSHPRNDFFTPDDLESLVQRLLEKGEQHAGVT